MAAHNDLHDLQYPFIAGVTIDWTRINAPKLVRVGNVYTSAKNAMLILAAEREAAFERLLHEVERLEVPAA